MTIGYDFRFVMSVKKANGKTYHRHAVAAIGLNFNIALWDVYFKLKKRKTIILSITSAEPLRVAFAFDANGPLRLKLSECMPEIPQDLNAELKYLPKL